MNNYINNTKKYQNDSEAHVATYRKCLIVINGIPISQCILVCKRVGSFAFQLANYLCSVQVYLSLLHFKTRSLFLSLSYSIKSLYTKKTISSYK